MLRESPMAFAMSDIFPKKTSKLRGPSFPATLMYLAPRTTIMYSVSNPSPLREDSRYRR